MTSSAAFIPLWAWIGIALATILLLIFTAELIRRHSNRRGDHNNANARRYRAVGSRPVNNQKTVPMVSYAEVRDEYERRLRHWHISGEELLTRLNEVERLDYRFMAVETLLQHSSPAELGNLTAIVGVNSDAKPVAIVDALRKAGSNAVASLIRRGHVPYEEVVRDVAMKLGAKDLPKVVSLAELEKVAIGAAMEKMLTKASPEERKIILAELAKNQATLSAGLVTATGGLILANLTGFGLYVAASSSLAAITSAVGLTLPFAIYTGVSSVLAAVTGPAGWAVLALFAIFKFGGAEYKKTVPGVIAIASSRARLIATREEELAKLHKQQDLHEESGGRLSILAKFVEDVRRSGENHRVPRAGVPW